MTTKTLVGGNKKASNMTENEQRRFGINKNLIKEPVPKFYGAGEHKVKLAYITEDEAKILEELDLYNSNPPHDGPGGLPNYNDSGGMSKGGGGGFDRGGGGKDNRTLGQRKAARRGHSPRAYNADGSLKNKNQIQGDRMREAWEVANRYEKAEQAKRDAAEAERQKERDAIAAEREAEANRKAEADRLAAEIAAEKEAVDKARAEAVAAANRKAEAEALAKEIAEEKAAVDAARRKKEEADKLAAEIAADKAAVDAARRKKEEADRLAAEIAADKAAVDAARKKAEEEEKNERPNIGEITGPGNQPPKDPDFKNPRDPNPRPPGGGGGGKDPVDPIIPPVEEEEEEEEEVKASKINYTDADEDVDPDPIKTILTSGMAPLNIKRRKLEKGKPLVGNQRGTRGTIRKPLERNYLVGGIQSADPRARPRPGMRPGMTRNV